MSFNISHLTMDDAKKMIPEFDYAILYKYSDLILCKANEITNDSFDECMEARIFCPDKELHIVFDDENSAVLVMDDASGSQEDEIIDKYQTYGRFKNIGDKIITKKYTKIDEDGQSIIVLTRLAGIE